MVIQPHSIDDQNDSNLLDAEQFPDNEILDKERVRQMVRAFLFLGNTHSPSPHLASEVALRKQREQDLLCDFSEVTLVKSPDKG